MEFLKEFNFETIEIDDVMRIVMNIYSLPKETQQIERIIGDLSLRLLGKWGFDDDTGIYQYIYLLLMVQTTNHNPQVK
jgi:Sec7-like guanine-nucleotide exchange factor